MAEVTAADVAAGSTSRHAAGRRVDGRAIARALARLRGRGRDIARIEAAALRAIGG